MKKFLVMLIAMSFCLAVSTPSAFAQHRWGGVAIGLGAGLLGAAIINNAYNAQPRERVVYVERGNSYYYPPPVFQQTPPPPDVSGHWEIRKSWVAPVYEKVWNPPHYNEYSQWVPGQWIQVEKRPGYWKEERVWVAER